MAPVLAKLVKCDLTGKEFGPTNPDTNTRFLVGVISLELLARYFCQLPLLRFLPQSIDSQQFTSHYFDGADRFTYWQGGINYNAIARF